MARAACERRTSCSMSSLAWIPSSAIGKEVIWPEGSSGKRRLSRLAERWSSPGDWPENWVNPMTLGKSMIVPADAGVKRLKPAMNCGRFIKGTKFLSASNWATVADRTATLACTVCTLARLRRIASARQSGTA